MSIRATNFVRRLRGISPEEKVVGFVLADHDDHKGSGTRPSMTTVAEESGIKNRETASRITARLADSKVIYSPHQSKGGKPTVYFFNYDLANCDSRITVAEPRTVTPRSRLQFPDRDSIPAKGAPTVTQKRFNRDSGVTGRVVKGSDDDGRGKSSSPQDAVENSDGDRLDDFKQIVLAKCKDDSDCTLSTALDIIIDRARRSGVNVTSPKYLEVALDRFNFHEGQDREDWMNARRGTVGDR
jgi:hypothetical protein